MAELSLGASGNVFIDAGQIVRVSTSGVATVVMQYGGPAGTDTITANTRDYGPYGVPAKIRITATSGTVTYRELDETPTFTPAQVQGLQGLVSVDGNLAANVGLTAQAAANRAFIQAALDLRGKVSIRTPGTIFIDDSLVIRSRTRLRLGKQTRIKLYRADSAPKPLIVTEAVTKMLAGTYIACTLAWTAGKSVTLTKAGHGLSVGDFVFIWSSTLAPSTFAGVFPVTAVTDADNVVIKLHRVPTAAPTGTAQYMVADQHITIDGGLWDMDYPARTTYGSNPYERYGMMLCGVAHLRVSNPEILACPKYLIYSGALWDYEFSGVKCNGTGSDGIKVYGPATKGVVRDFSGVVNDDGVSCQTKEPAAFLAYMLFWGDVDGLEFRNIGVHSVANAVVVFPTADQYMGGITVDGVDGSVGAGGCSVNFGQTNAVLNDITVRQVRATGLYGLSVRNNGFTGGRIRMLKYVDCPGNVEEYGTSKKALFVDTNVGSIDHMVMEDIATNPLYGGTSYIYAETNSPVGHLELRGGTVEFANALPTFFAVASTVQAVTVSGLRVAANCATLFRHTGTGSPNVTFTGCDFNQTGGACWSSNVGVTVNLYGNRINVGSQGVVRSNTTASIMRINSGGNEWVTSNVFSNGSVTGLWQFRGFDIPINLNATGVQKTIPGQFAFNTTLAGTLAANRLAICDGTSWKQADNLANVF